MKKTIKLAVVAALALGATSVFATNGSNLIGLGAKARGMGGVGIGMSHGAESGLANGALITSVEGTEISFGGTIFMPNVSTNNGGGSDDSTANLSVIPEVSIASKINDNLNIGIGMWGTAGMGVDHRTDASNMLIVTNLQLMQFGVPVAYTTNGVSVAITPVLQYGSLDINYKNGANPAAGAGVAQDLQFGYNLGLAYEISGLTIGAMYKSQIDMDYKNVLSSTLSGFVGYSGTGTYSNEKLSTPAEMGIGASYVFGESTVALDYKQIKWSSAKGYEDFAWNDQNIIAIGYEYATTDWAARIGYNYSTSPIEEQTPGVLNGAGIDGGYVNMLNLLGFPAIIETHIAIGGSYNLNKTTSVDLAYVYAPEVTKNYSTGAGTIETSHSQTSLSAQLTFVY